MGLTKQVVKVTLRASRHLPAFFCLVYVLTVPITITVGTDDGPTPNDSDLLSDLALAVAEDALMSTLDGNDTAILGSSLVAENTVFGGEFISSGGCSREIDEVFKAAAAVVDAQHRLEVAKIRLSACINGTSNSAPPVPIPLLPAELGDAFLPESHDWDN